MDVKFNDRSVVHILEVFGHSVNEDGLVVTEEGEVVTDTEGFSIRAENISKIIDLEGPFSVENDQVLYEGSPLPKDDPTNRPEIIVPLTTETGVVRDGFSSLIELSEIDEL